MPRSGFEPATQWSEAQHPTTGLWHLPDNRPGLGWSAIIMIILGFTCENLACFMSLCSRNFWLINITWFTHYQTDQRTTKHQRCAAVSYFIEAHGWVLLQISHWFSLILHGFLNQISGSQILRTIHVLVDFDAKTIMMLGYIQIIILLLHLEISISCDDDYFDDQSIMGDHATLICILTHWSYINLTIL